MYDANPTVSVTAMFIPLATLIGLGGTEPIFKTVSKMDM